MYKTIFLNNEYLFSIVKLFKMANKYILPRELSNDRLPNRDYSHFRISLFNASINTTALYCDLDVMRVPIQGPYIVSSKLWYVMMVCGQWYYSPSIHGIYCLFFYYIIKVVKKCFRSSKLLYCKSRLFIYLFILLLIV